MTADPSVTARRKPGWYVVTDQGLVLSTGFGDRRRRCKCGISWSRSCIAI